MRVLILGSTDLTLAVAEQVLTIGQEVVGLMSVPPIFSISYQPRGMQNVRAVDIVSWCESNAVSHDVYENPDSIASFKEFVRADFALAAGWYHMIPRRIRNLFPRGCAGLHASLLPELRGNAPLNWALLSRKKETGISLFEFSDGVDTGPLFGQRSFPITPDTYIDDLVKAAEKAAKELIAECLPKIESGTLRPDPQRGKPSYCLARLPEDGLIDWTKPAESIALLVRAVSRPYPGAFSYLDSQMIVIWRAKAILNGPQVYGLSGQITHIPDFDHTLVVTGEGVIAIEEATLETGKSCLDLLRKANHRRFK